jgi:hypothetical protein
MMGSTKQFSPTRVAFLLVLILFQVSVLLSTAEAATLSLAPSQGNFPIGEDFTIRVLLDSPDQAANAVSGVINFPSDKLQIVGLAKGPIISFWVEQPSYSNNQGTARFEGVAFNPGFSGQDGRVLSLTFRGQKTGEATLQFQSAAVLANDGQGSDITEGKRGATITLLPRRIVSPVVPGVVVVIISPTHPDSSLWYSNRKPRFELAFPSSTQAVSFSLDNQATTTPTTTIKELVTSYDSPELLDGIWYFHARLRQTGVWSEDSHFAVHIDSEPPRPFDIKLIDGGQMLASYPELVFGTTDTLSGVDHYEVSINDEKIATLKASPDEPYHLVRLPRQSWGRKVVQVEAIDRAHNTRVAIAEFTVRPSTWLFILIGAFLLIVILIIWFVLKRLRKGKKMKNDAKLNTESLLPEKADGELSKQSEAVNRDLNSLYVDLRNLLAIKSQHKAFTYLRQARDLKFSEEKIKQELRAVGWSDEEIKALLEEDKAITAITQKIAKDLKELDN